MRTAGAAMLPVLAMVETKPIPVCLQETYVMRELCQLAGVQAERFHFLLCYVAAEHKIKYLLIRLHSQPQNEKEETF